MQSETPPPVTTVPASTSFAYVDRRMPVAHHPEWRLLGPHDFAFGGRGLVVAGRGKRAELDVGPNAPGHRQHAEGCEIDRLGSHLLAFASPPLWPHRQKAAGGTTLQQGEGLETTKVLAR